ncbi:hypothetical protein ACA910_008845 [Epithemia clementina (nom. ined.)]
MIENSLQSLMMLLQPATSRHSTGNRSSKCPTTSSLEDSLNSSFAVGDVLVDLQKTGAAAAAAAAAAASDAAAAPRQDDGDKDDNEDEYPMESSLVEHDKDDCCYWNDNTTAITTPEDEEEDDLTSAATPAPVVRRTVRFAEERCNQYYYKCQQEEDECLEDLWYSDDDYHRMYNDIKRARRQMKWMEQQQRLFQQQQRRRDEEGEDEELEEELEDCGDENDGDRDATESDCHTSTRRTNLDNDFSFSTSLQVLFQETCAVNRVVRDASQWVQTNHPALERRMALLYTGCQLDWIGLEPHAFRRDTQQRRQALWEVLTDIQSEYEQGLWTVQGRDLEWRDCCRQISQPHALLAQLLAQSQRMASAFDE